MWWKVFASHWNGTSLFIHAGQPDIMITSDASGSWGCEAWSQQKWFQLQWAETIQTHFSEGAGAYIVIAIHIWGHASVCGEDSFVQLRQLCSSICPHESHQQRQRYDAASALPVLPRSIFSVPPCSPSHPMTAQTICHVIVYVRSVLKL